MKLSDLIAYRTLLRRYQPRDITGVLDQQLGPLVHAIDNSHIRFVDAESRIHQTHDAITTSLTEFDQAMQSLLSIVEENIASMTSGYLARSYKLYSENMRNDTPELILSRRITLTPDLDEYVCGRLKLYTDWRRAGMIMRPADNDWIRDLVALDPLYILDTHRELLNPAMASFTPEYQRRIRPYVIDEGLDRPLLTDLPNAQIGFCVVYNFFHYKPFELIRQYLAEIYNKLQPGGRLFFTINDCDRQGGVDNSERSYMCFTPSSLITPLVQTLGYNIDQTCELDAACTWYELSKPGEFHTLRGGQNLARINWHSNAIDTETEVQYTNKQIDKLIKQASKLGIDTALPPEQLQQLIKERKSS
jgi:hypothetical protein